MPMPARAPVYSPARLPTQNKRGYNVPAWSGAGGSLPPVGLDIRASVGTSTSPTSTGTKAVTGVGFTPKVVLPWSTFSASDGATTEAFLSLGAGISSTSRSVVAASSLNARTTSSTHRRHTAAKVLTDSNGGSTFLEADFASQNANGFTLDWTTVTGVNHILNHICLGGADLEVSLTQQQMNGTNAAQSFAHGLSGAPTGVLFFDIQTFFGAPATLTELNLGIGAWAGGSQFGASVYSQNGGTTTRTRRLLIANGVLAQLEHVQRRTMAVASVDSSNVNVTYPVSSNSDPNNFFMLAIRGAKCQVGTFKLASSGTIATPGITPKLFLPVFVYGAVDGANSVGDHVVMSIGASDGTNNVSCGITDQNNLTTTNARRFQSSSKLMEYDLSGNVRLEATAAFSGESVVVSPTQFPYSDWGQAAYLILGS